MDNEIEEIRPQRVNEAAEERRARKRKAARDEAGFATEAIPTITTQQAKWIAARAALGSNAKACEATGVELFRVAEWFDDADFVSCYNEMMENRREGFKTLATMGLPQAFVTLLDIMENGEKDADRVKAATLLLRNQGLLIDKVTTVDKGALAALFEEYRQPRPIIKTLPAPNSPNPSD
jgi:hypothetical protein